jgi:probable F420-dependent oxidoreductase
LQLDAFFDPATQLSAIPDLARQAEQIGFKGVWLAETQHNPFLAATLVAEQTKKIQVGTAIAVSFARSPAIIAQTAFDLAQLSNGRFQLGLGTQVRGHIERRFGMDWPDSPVEKLGEQIQLVRNFWNHWQLGAPLNHRGEYYKVTLTSPFFEPQPIAEPQIPIWIAGVNKGMAHLAGEQADGFLVHPYHSRDYLQQNILPAIKAGVQRAGRTDPPKIMVNAFVITNDAERESVRKQISFYASTPSYHKVMRHHGWQATAGKLAALAARKKWEEIASLISDEMLATFSVMATEKDLPEALLQRYASFADRITLYSPYIPGERDSFWHHLSAQLNGV